jgi:hypothetical protein
MRHDRLPRWLSSATNNVPVVEKIRQQPALFGQRPEKSDQQKASESGRGSRDRRL